MYLYTMENTENRIPILVKEKDVSNRETSVTSPESIADLFNHAFNLRYKASEIMGISLIDSIIIGDYYYSFNENGI